MSLAPSDRHAPASCPHHRVAIVRVGVVLEVDGAYRRRYLRETGVCRGCTSTVTRRTELPERPPRWSVTDRGGAS